jgi:biotin carboxyl carrier protein
MKEFKYTINGNVYNVSIDQVVEDFAQVEVNGTKYNVQLQRVVKKSIQPLAKAAAAAVAKAATSPAPAPTSASGERVVSAPAADTSTSKIQSPLPGVILDIAVKVGDTVTKGQKLLILEAMKMENNINADRNGKVIEIKVNKGDSILEGADLLIIG